MPSASFLDKLEKVYIPPMSGVTDLPFRLLVRELLGKELVKKVRLSTEMVSSKGIVYHLYQDKKSPERLRLHPTENDVVVQIFGHEPEFMAKAAQSAEQEGARAIDINMGCPVPKITKGKDGAALMKEPELALKIVKEVIRAVEIPVSVKTRLGWDSQQKNALELILRLQDAGLSSATIHGRTRSAFYSGEASWQEIEKIISDPRLEIPVFANGDINTAERAYQALRQTKAHGVAVARGIIGNISLIRKILEKIDPPSDSSNSSKLSKTPRISGLEIAQRHLELAYEYKGERGVVALKRHLRGYLHKHPKAAFYREKLSRAQSYQESKELLQRALLESETAK